MSFSLLSQSVDGARRGIVHTAHGDVATPFFMTIATQGAVKGLAPSDLRRLGVPIVLANTYHLMCRPGLEAMRVRGGLHAWMGWDGPLLTDSGGYQVFSLAKLRRVTEEGVTFQSHIDGARIELTPERSIEMQSAIGSDICMCLDVVLPPSATRGEHEEAMERSLRWAARCREAHARVGDDSQLFGIVQGGLHEDLRARSVEGLVALEFDGYAIGGLSVGESREDNMYMAAFVAARLPEDKPRYFMGGGMPEEIAAYVGMGIDMFDCVIPTRHARHGQLFVWRDTPNISDSTINMKGVIGHQVPLSTFYDTLHIENNENREKDAPVDVSCDCMLCREFTVSYLHHLYKSGEMLGMRLATEHNVRFYMRLMDALRG